MLWAEADQHVQAILAHMRGCQAVEQIEAAGSYRRGKDTVGDLDFLVVAAQCRRGDGPPGRLTAASARSSPAATRKCRSG